MTARRVPDWLVRWEYAHRGLHGPGVPENSLAAAEGAIAAGMGIECDIQLSADGAAMVFHDWELSRLTGTAGFTNGRIAAELEELVLLGTAQRPFRLAAMLDRIAGRVPLLIEIKSRARMRIAPACAAVAYQLAEYDGPAAVMSFDPRVAHWFRRHAPHICGGLVMREDAYGDTQTAWRRKLALRIAQPDFLAYHINALPSPWVAGLRAKGMPVLSWTVNSPETRSRALLHADALITEGAGLA